MRADWAAAQRADIDYTDFTPNQEKQNSVKFGLRESEQLSVSIIQKEAAAQATLYQETIDSHIYGIMRAGVSTSSPDKRHEIGAADTFLANNGALTEATAGGIGKGIWQALSRVIIQAAADKVATPVADAPSSLWVTTPVVIWETVMEWLRENGGSDQVATLAIRNGMIARVKGILDIILTNANAVQTISSKDYNVMLVGTNVATTYADRPTVFQMLTPSTNQAGPFYQINQLRRYGGFVENAIPLQSIVVRNEA